MTRVGFLVHNEGDSVGVATVDIAEGETVSGRFLNDGKSLEVKVLDNIPLGHKIALSDIKYSSPVTEYGQCIGKATADVRVGQHVHTHNLKSERWK